MCINSTSKSAPVIYCRLIDHIKIYGFKQQLVIFSQGSVGCLSSAGSFHLSYLMRLWSDGGWDQGHLNTWVGWLKRWLTQWQVVKRWVLAGSSTGVVNQRTQMCPRWMAWTSHGGWILRWIVFKSRIIREKKEKKKNYKRPRKTWEDFSDPTWNYNNITFTE